MTKQQKKPNGITRRKAQLPIIGTFSLLGSGLSAQTAAPRASILPKGLMLNLDFERAHNGLIPSKSLFPLYVPQNNLVIERTVNRNLLMFQPDEGLSIPHSALLDPAGDEWVLSIRLFLLTDGLILSQGNEQHGFMVYSQEGQIFVRARTGHTAFMLNESSVRGIHKYRKRWVTIEVRLRNDIALLSLNRKRACMVTGEPALSGSDLRLRLGDHRKKPGFVKNFKELPSIGFSGAISSLKIHRQ
ncbi:hypothetical protein P4B35_15980 [Pontiellaceae bacterium B12227]|nr:hypothetical protein [Pontiellaceae bacterium B12227]